MRKQTMAFVLLVLTGCSRKEAPASGPPPAVTISSAVAVPLATSGAFTAVLEGERVTFAYGIAEASHSGIQISLSSEKLECGASPYKTKHSFLFDLPPGPQKSFFSGHTIGVPAAFRSDLVKLESKRAEAHELTVNLRPFTVAAAGRIKGTLALEMKRDERSYKGEGTFDVELCPDKSDFKGFASLSASAPSGPVSGIYDGERFTYRTALATLSRDEATGADYLRRITFYAFAATCAGERGAWEKGSAFVMEDIGGASAKQDFRGTEQPAFPFFSRVDRDAKGKARSSSKESFGVGIYNAWVKLDLVDLKEGAVVEGSLIAESEPAAEMKFARGAAFSRGRMAGRFKATVCKDAP